MSLQSLLRSIDDVAAELPFAVDDYEAANATFARWLEHEAEDDYQAVMMWVYCYTRRYFVTRWMIYSSLPESHIERPMEDAFRSCRESLRSVKEPGAFSAFVSVVCRNRFRNALRQWRKHGTIPLILPTHDRIDEDTLDERQATDLELVVGILEQAIADLPAYLQEPARMHLIERLDYNLMAARTGQLHSTLRSYVRKAKMRLREDPRISTLLRDS